MGAATSVLLTLLAVQAAPFGAADPAPPPGNTYVITLEAGTSAGEKQEIREEAAAGGEIRRSYTQALNGFAATLSPAAAAELRTDPNVRSVVPDVKVSVDSIQAPAPWNLDRIDQRDRPLNDAYEYGATGAGVTVYVLDTGIRADHVEFGGRVAGGYSAVGDGKGTQDCEGHGTHVAGTIGGSTYGVAKGVTLVPVRVLGCDGTGEGAALLSGLDWVIGNHVPGRSIINMSLGGPPVGFIDQAVNRAIAAGIPVVTAAGNEGSEACGFSPARVPNAITVGAVDSADAKPAFSNFGACVDLFAPGVGIISAYNSSPTALASASGTSSAAPHVSGLLATMLQAAPATGPAALSATLGELLTIGGLSGIGSGSPNASLYAPPSLRLPGVGTATTGGFIAALAGDASALSIAGTPQVEAFGVTGSGTIVTQLPEVARDCAIPRPRSHAASRAALVASVQADDRCLAFATAERLDLTPATVRLAYVPFARDTVTFALHALSSLPKSMSLTTLRQIYRCELAMADPPRPMLPAEGSGLREFWIDLMYPGGMPAPKPPCLADGIDDLNQAIAPNSAVGLGHNEIVPVSVAHWIGQTSGVIGIDRRAASRIGRIDGISPFADDPAVARDLYVVIPSTALDGQGFLGTRLRRVFVGSDSLLCGAMAGPVAVRHGFRQHPACGSTNLRTP